MIILLFTAVWKELLCGSSYVIFLLQEQVTVCKVFIDDAFCSCEQSPRQIVFPQKWEKPGTLIERLGKIELQQWLLNFLLWHQSSNCSAYESCVQHGFVLPRPCASPWHTCFLPSSVVANNFQPKFWSEGVPGTILHRWIRCSFWSWWISKHQQVILCQLASAPGNVN